MTELILLHENQHMMALAIALFIDAHAGIRLHDRAAQAALHIRQLNFSSQCAQRAFAAQFQRIPNGYSINMVLHISQLLIRCNQYSIAYLQGKCHGFS